MNFIETSKLPPNFFQTAFQLLRKFRQNLLKSATAHQYVFFFNSFCPKIQKIVLNKLPICFGNLSLSIKSRFSTFLTNRVNWEENSEAQKFQNYQRPRKFTHFRKFKHQKIQNSTNLK